MKMNVILRKTMPLLVVSTLCVGTQSFAQEVPDGNKARLEEIVVTAQRKNESLQDVPISITAVLGDKLFDMGLTSTADLPQVVPGLTFITTGPAGTPFLRGVGSNAGNPNDEPSVATYVDGVYIASPSSAIMKFNNLERVEVLKGPQGTLFGRNATGGVIQLITRDPSFDPLLEVSLGVGNYETIEASLYASTGLTDSLAIDISLQADDQSKGFGKSTVTGEDIRMNSSESFRTKLLYQPNEQFSARLSLDYSERDSSQLIYTMPEGVLAIDGQPAPSNIYDSRSFITYEGIGIPEIISEQQGVSLNLNYETDNYRFVSISAYREAESVYYPEADASPLPVVEGTLPNSQDSISQEFQIMSNSDSWLDWVAGLYLFRSDAGYDNIEFSGLAFAVPAFSGIGSFLLDARQETKSGSIYVQGTGALSDNTNLTAGLRYTDEEQELETVLFGTKLPSPSKKGFDELTWRIALDHAFSDDVLGYISHNRGVKGGGFDLLDPFTAGYEPETLDAYEIGVKSELLGRTLRLNAALFFYDYENIQVQVIPSGNSGAVITTNAGVAEIKGLDVDFLYVPTDALSLSGGFAFIDGEYKEFKDTISYHASPLSGPGFLIDASGNDTIRTPDFSANITAEYRIQSSYGEFPLSMTVSHNGGFFFGADNRLEQEAYTVLNASIGWRSIDGKYGATLWGRNLTEEEYLTQGVPSGLGDLISPAAPRTYGVTFYANFGAD